MMTTHEQLRNSNKKIRVEIPDSIFVQLACFAQHWVEHDVAAPQD